MVSCGYFGIVQLIIAAVIFVLTMLLISVVICVCCKQKRKRKNGEGEVFTVLSKQLNGLTVHVSISLLPAGGSLRQAPGGQASQ